MKQNLYHVLVYGGFPQTIANLRKEIIRSGFPVELHFVESMRHRLPVIEYSRYDLVIWQTPNISHSSCAFLKRKAIGAGIDHAQYTTGSGARIAADIVQRLSVRVS